MSYPPPPDIPHPDRVKRKLAAVPAYVKETYDIDVTRQTIYNWIKRGRKGHTLRCEADGLGNQWTTWLWVREFMAKVV